jgi:CheY-like chemotaxis protein/anti-sigma regulatory factor (Ser/Thr protein kinase)
MLAISEPATKSDNSSQAQLVRVLVVDDSAVDRLVVGRLLTRTTGWQVAYAEDGLVALDMIQQMEPTVALTDLQMPRLDGLAFVEQVRNKFPHIPVVLMTAHGSEEIAIAALRAGATSYVSKRSLKDDLVATLEQVMAISKTNKNHNSIISKLRKSISFYELDNDSSVVAPLVNLIREDLLAIGLCDATTATRVGIALEEALLNAIYHGNLEVSSKLKLVDDGGAFQNLVTQRRSQDPYQNRRVQVTVQLRPSEAKFVISDSGPGFDVSQLPDPTDPENLLMPHGRGVLFMRTFMDEVRYNSRGNRVVLIKRRDPRNEI